VTAQRHAKAYRGVDAARLSIAMGRLADPEAHSDARLRRACLTVIELDDLVEDSATVDAAKNLLAALTLKLATVGEDD
jgi:hypothetical protein